MSKTKKKDLKHAYVISMSDKDIEILKKVSKRINLSPSATVRKVSYFLNENPEYDFIFEFNDQVRFKPDPIEEEVLMKFTPAIREMIRKVVTENKMVKERNPGADDD